MTYHIRTTRWGTTSRPMYNDGTLEISEGSFVMERQPRTQSYTEGMAFFLPNVSERMHLIADLIGSLPAVEVPVDTLKFMRDLRRAADKAASK